MLVGKLLWRLMEEVTGEGSPAGGAPAPIPAEPQEEAAPVDKWGEFLADEDEEEIEIGVPDEPAVPETQPETPPEETVSPIEVPATPTGQEPLSTPTKPAMSPEEAAAVREQYRASLEKAYEFSEDDATALQVEPEKVLPKLAAKLHLEVLDSVMQHVLTSLPDVIKRQTESSSLESRAKGEFFSAWPELAGHDEQVLQMGKMFRQLNPTADPQTAIQKIGEMTMVALGKQRVAKAQVETPVAPAVPFRPAAPGRVGTPPPAKTKWEAVFDDDDD